MEIDLKKLFIFVIFLFLFLVITKFQIHSNLNEDHKNFGKLTSSGWILLTSENDILCKRQIEILGYLNNLIPKWDILKDKDKIKNIGAKKLKYVPCWFNVFTKKYKYGVQSLSDIENYLKK